MLGIVLEIFLVKILLPVNVSQPDGGIGQLERVPVGPSVAADHVHAGAGPEYLARPPVKVKGSNGLGVGHVHIMPRHKRNMYWYW